MQPHVAALSAAANSSLFALKTLQRLGLKPESLWSVSRAILMAKITYCSPAWRGFLSLNEIDRIKSLVRRAQRWGLYSNSGQTVDEIFDKSDRQLFKKIAGNPDHVLHHILPPIKNVAYNLRSRGHGRVLPEKTTSLSRNFMTRMLYSTNSY
jgi:hypothetical protein